ncbi:MAG: gamma-glutamyltransferase family protein [Acidobacteria bacterium]|nr:gamma-glutamyltransferase family protein [Acidobacteriota bacterium]
MPSRNLYRITIFCVLATLASGPIVGQQSTLERLKQQQEALRWQVIRPVVRGDRAAVAAGTPNVTESAMRIMHEGGNAVDAGVAAMFAGAVTEFSHFGFGGEAPILIRTPEGKVFSIAGVGTAPQLMTREFFLSRRTQPELEQESNRRGRTQGPIPSYGILPALVPGMVDAGLVALKHYGDKSFAEVIQPALELADAYPIDEMRSRSIATATRFLRRFPTSKDVFLPGGLLPRPGDIFRQPDLARTIRGMANAEKKALAAGKSREQAIDAVRDYFYRGEIARKIGDFVKANDGLLRYEDMAAFRLEVEEPVSTTFHGYEVFKSGFWTQGAVMVEALNILEGYQLDALGWNSPEYIHLLTEALKLAYADRDTWYADPKFEKIPVELLSKAYAAKRRELIDPRHANPDFRPGRFGSGEPPHPSTYVGQMRPLTDALASHDTTCVNVIDKNGWMFSATPSGAWMPSVIAGDTGIPLTQRAQSFLLMPDHPNVVEPGKRPRITLSPTIVTHGGEPYMALSTPGGDQQDQALLQVLLASMLFDFNPQAAVEAPRLQTRHLVSSFDDHAMDPNKLLLDERIPESVLQELLEMGHDIERRSRWDSGSAPTALRTLPNGVIEAGADPYAFRYADGW